MDFKNVNASLRAAGERVVRRPLQRALQQGYYATPLDFDRDRVVMLFYEDFDQDRMVRGDRHAIRFARQLVHLVRHGQKTTGFRVAYEALARSLRLAGYTVVENDYALARANPTYPIGVSGYPHVLTNWSLPNPTVIGPGLYDHPSQRPELMNDRRFVSYIAHSKWVQDLFGATYKDACRIWFAGIDMDQWPDLSAQPKDLDFIVYDKIHWNQEQVRSELRWPLEAELKRRGLSSATLVYKRYDHAEYRALLGRTRGMIFLSEHETQGLAYQEAMSTNVPILAWDPGFWHDPVRFKYGAEHVATSSVPFFKDGVTGERFRDAVGMRPALDRFLAGRAGYTPRAFVREELSLQRSAETYLALYREALQRGLSPS